MSLVISNAFKGLLLSSYVNIKLESPVKSLQDLVDKKSVDIIFDKSFDEIRTNKDTRIPEIIQLERRAKIMQRTAAQLYDPITNQNDIIKMSTGQAVILCNSFNCQFYKLVNPHLRLFNTEDHYFHNYEYLRFSKFHSHSKQIKRM